MAWKMAGIHDPLHELDFVELHDAYTSSEIQTYEDLGCAATGRAGRLPPPGRLYARDRLRAGAVRSPGLPGQPFRRADRLRAPGRRDRLMQAVFAIWQLQGTASVNTSAMHPAGARARRGAIHSHAGTGTYVTVSILEQKLVAASDQN
jgi:acetyl-CoA C-acetyltransferase